MSLVTFNMKSNFIKRYEEGETLGYNLHLKTSTEPKWLQCRTPQLVICWCLIFRHFQWL